MQNTEEIIKDMKKQLDSLEDLVYWTVTAEQRGFEVGRRVTFSDRAIRRRIVRGDKAKQVGTITEIVHGFGVKVRFDSVTKARSYNHSFLELTD